MLHTQASPAPPLAFLVTSDGHEIHIFRSIVNVTVSCSPAVEASGKKEAREAIKSERSSAQAPSSQTTKQWGKIVADTMANTESDANNRGWFGRV
jgi:hypothetical protein